MAASAKRERQVASFDEGELWCSDEADPPLSPAGWYFRVPRGTPQLWIGPFAEIEDAEAAPFSGDALRDAQRYLRLWQRGEPPPRPKLVVVAAAPVATVPPPKPQMEMELSGAGEAPQRKPARRSSSRRAPATQLPLVFDL